MSTLLIADDEQTFLDFMVRLLQKEHNLLIARNWNEVLEKFESNLWRLNAMILDVNMPGLSVDPFTMIDKILKSNSTVPMIIISGQDIVLRHEFLKMGVFQYHGKPIDMMDLKLTIQSALQYNQMRRKLENYEKGEQEASNFFQNMLNINILEIQEDLMASDTEMARTPVLIRCEAGCRPSMLAKVICHEIDKKLYFERVCSNSLKNLIPHNLQDGDTLYLEGVERLGEEEHQYLLKVVDEITSEKNTNRTPVARFRLIASVFSLSDEKVDADSTFGKLLQKLSQIEFRIEPLRLRQHELRNMIEMLFEKKRRALLSQVEKISDEMYDLLYEYQWPLNYDELELVIESLLITCNEKTLLPKHLHQLDFSNIAVSKYPSLDDMIDEHIKKALRLTMGNKSRAAKMLGITPKTLYARIRH